MDVCRHVKILVNPTVFEFDFKSAATFIISNRCNIGGVDRNSVQGLCYHPARLMQPPNHKIWL